MKEQSVIREQTVSLFMREWIEMNRSYYWRGVIMSPSSWGSGLKYTLLTYKPHKHLSPSSWGSGLKFFVSSLIGIFLLGNRWINSIPTKEYTFQSQEWQIKPWKMSVFHGFPLQMWSITLKRADLPLGRAKVFLDTLHHQQICTRKQNIQFV